MLIRSTAHPSYCPFAILPIRHTATSDLRRVPIRPIEKCPSDQLKMPIRSLLTSGATTPQWRNLPLPTESLFITTLSTMDTGQALPKYQLLARTPSGKIVKLGGGGGGDSPPPPFLY